MKKGINVVVDCDEVLTDISPLWTQKIYENRDYFDKFFNLEESFDMSNPEDYKKILSRKDFYLNKHFMKNDLSEEDKKEVQEKFMELYDNEEFYSECFPTKAFANLLNMKQGKLVEKIYVVTRTTEKTKQSKEEFIRMYSTIIGSDDLEIINVGTNEKKSDYIKDLPNIGMVIDDELKNINDIIDNCPNIWNNEVVFFVPYTGYNEPTAELYDKVDEKEISLMYYPIFNIGEEEILSNEELEKVYGDLAI
ncbi:hypothetical protein Bp8pS_216 [Bacillus phage vB_BpuM-BpSp]|nr:hypothetical protein Bp8pS_216 [Bacillus phage vB_BpuM-BpSp]